MGRPSLPAGGGGGGLAVPVRCPVRAVVRPRGNSPALRCPPGAGAEPARGSPGCGTRRGPTCCRPAPGDAVTGTGRCRPHTPWKTSRSAPSAGPPKGWRPAGGRSREQPPGRGWWACPSHLDMVRQPRGLPGYGFYSGGGRQWLPLPCHGHGHWCNPGPAESDTIVTAVCAGVYAPTSQHLRKDGQAALL